MERLSGRRNDRERSGPEDVVASQTSGLLLTRAVQATAATFPDAAASLAAVARAVLRGEPIDQGAGETSLNRETSLNLTLRPDECRSAASYVAAGLQLATRRGAPPPPGRGSPDAWHRVGDVSADAIRACVALASCPAGGGRCFELARDVAEAWAVEGYSNPTQGADVEARTTHPCGRVTRTGRRRTSGERGGARTLVHRDVVRARARPVPSVRRHPPDVEWDALDAISVGTNRSSAAGAYALLASARARADPGRASASVAACARAPLAKRAPAIATLVAERVTELHALRGGFTAGGSQKTGGPHSIRSFAARARELAVAVHDASRGSNRSPRRRGSDRSTPPRRTRRSRARSSPC